MLCEKRQLIQKNQNYDYISEKKLAVHENAKRMFVLTYKYFKLETFCSNALDILVG